MVWGMALYTKGYRAIHDDLPYILFSLSLKKPIYMCHIFLCVDVVNLLTFNHHHTSQQGYAQHAIWKSAHRV